MICESCSIKKESYLFDYDHKIQKCFLDDDSNCITNIQVLCLDCHRIKSLIENTVVRPFQRNLESLLDSIDRTELFEMQAPKKLSKSLIQHIIKDINLTKGRKFLNKNYKKKNKFVLNKWKKQDERNLMKIINSQKRLTCKLNWSEIHKHFNETSKHTRSLLSIKRKYQRLI